MEKYQQVISLGFFCSPAPELQRIARRQSSYPFDWLITPDFSVVMDLIHNGFQDFLKEEYMFQLTEYPQYYRNTKLHIDFYHDFSPFKSFRAQIVNVTEKYDRRIQRFYKAITQPTLFCVMLPRQKSNTSSKTIRPL